MKGFSTNILHLIFGLLLCLPAFGQQQDERAKHLAREEARELMQEAEIALGENNFAVAEAAYRKAIAKNPESSAARYNMGNMYYTRDNSVQASQRFKQAAEVAETKLLRHRANHNLGNAYMKQKKYQEAVDAYKDALRNDPTDDETRYNLALAKKMLEEQKKKEDKNKGGGDNKNQDQKNQDKENQDKQNQGQNKDQKNKENQDQGDQEDKGEDKGDQDQQNKDQEEKEGDQNQKKQPGEKGDQKEKEQEQQPKQQGQPQPAQGQLSPEQVRSLLQAMSNEERKVQDKLNAKKQKGAKVQSEKDW
ncbi:tetratricopeptide repeat protein [Salegentibacter sp. 24]|jgi:tetratricopeptide (TPR) repeat protein|uniref:tetratricopeptide repeat protein n=1 Tax=Salegentibacter sp. 24 TaxID=2183986 RepID=UPI00105CD6E2|nr:tetratricopeptide repeat protein [Salegentibacter sp. 24]TDN88100.1 tetratricopeptide repeat protein [Salegentibacter sp. 24]